MVCAFGRLGTMFGCDYYHIKPDLVSIAKVCFISDLSLVMTYKCAFFYLKTLLILQVRLGLSSCDLWNLQKFDLESGST